MTKEKNHGYYKTSTLCISYYYSQLIQKQLIIKE